MQCSSEKMEKIKYRICLGMLGFCLLNPAITQAKDGDKEKPADPIRRERSMRSTITAKVTAVNSEKREITLKGAEGREETLIVDKKVKRFDEIKVGDSVTAEYYASVAGEVREPTPEEKAAPISETLVSGKESAPNAPGAGGMRVIKVVTKVEDLEPATKTIAIKGPLGRTFHVAIKDSATFEKLKRGDSIVITFTEAAAISLVKQP